MSKKLIAVKPRVAKLIDFDIPLIKDDEVLIEVNYASPKHGTDLTDFRGNSPWETEIFDEQKRLFKKREQQKSGVDFGNWNLGNIIVGHIIDAGSKVTEYNIGDRVCTYGGICEHLVVKAVDNYRLRKMSQKDSWKNAMCYDPMQYALGAIRDAKIRPGDEVLIFGLGAIGLLSVSIAKKIGAKVIGVDPLEIRRTAACAMGADETLDPTTDDIGEKIKLKSDYGGCDAVIETSGSPLALQQALRGVSYGGVIAYVAFAKEIKGGLNFGREAHFNNPEIVFSRAANEPNRDYPRWNRKRIEDTSWNFLMDGHINCEAIIGPTVDFNEVDTAYMKYVDQEPHLSVKLGVIVKEDLDDVVNTR